MSQTSKPLIIAHRGAAGDAPENTLAAFKLALAQGCDGYELDVHLSKDKQIMVIHDDTLDRTTNGSGEIKHLTAAQIGRFDAGVKFTKAHYPNEIVPTLEQVFDLVPSNFFINIELKGGIGEGLEEAVVELLHRTNRIDSVIISSFDHKGLVKIKELEPALKIGILYSLRTTNHWMMPQVAGVETTALHPWIYGLDEEDIQSIKDHGLAINTWTVNSVEQIEKAVQFGVEGIITDYPATTRAIVEKLLS